MLTSSASFICCSRFGEAHPYSSIVLATGELHGVGHVFECQVVNLITLVPGVGRPVMEQAEQFWARLKYPAKKFRFVSIIQEKLQQTARCGG